MGNFEIGTRRECEQYRARSCDGYPGDLVESHARKIGTTWFDFSRVHWGDGTVTVRVWEYGTTNLLREWRSDPPVC